MKKIKRRTFIQLSAAAATGCLMASGREARAQGDLPHLSPDDPMAQAMKYTHDASTVDASAKPNPAENQNCANCALIQGEDGAEWRPCQIFPGKLVNANGWCSVWAPKA
ncbi:MAG TPA: high-potential iron-sulfur protein [Woeseiaceae bacterium]|nr:high-potential iron-sulfur protein [Woeseiaceae bacterium]